MYPGTVAWSKNLANSGVISLGTEQRTGTTASLCLFQSPPYIQSQSLFVFFPQSSEKGRVCWERVSLTSWLASWCWQRHGWRLAVFFLASVHKYYEDKGGGGLHSAPPWTSTSSDRLHPEERVSLLTCTAIKGKQ